MEKIAEFLFQTGFLLFIFGFCTVVLAVGRLSHLHEDYENINSTFADRILYVNKFINFNELKNKIKNRPKENFFKILFFYIGLFLGEIGFILFYLCMYLGFLLFMISIIIYGILLF